MPLADFQTRRLRHFRLRLLLQGYLLLPPPRRFAIVEFAFIDAVIDATPSAIKTRHTLFRLRCCLSMRR